MNNPLPLKSLYRFLSVLFLSLCEPRLTVWALDKGHVAFNVVGTVDERSACRKNMTNNGAIVGRAFVLGFNDSESVRTRRPCWRLISITSDLESFPNNEDMAKENRPGVSRSSNSSSRPTL